jgi:hypothetical protein
MLAMGHNIPTIISATGLCKRTIETIRRQWEETGLYQHQIHNEVLGRPHLLSVGDIWVSKISHTLFHGVLNLTHFM